MKSIIVFKETITYCRTSMKWMNELCAVVKCGCNCAYNYYST